MALLNGSSVIIALLCEQFNYRNMMDNGTDDHRIPGTRHRCLLRCIARSCCQIGTASGALLPASPETTLHRPRSRSDGIWYNRRKYQTHELRQPPAYKDTSTECHDIPSHYTKQV